MEGTLSFYSNPGADRFCRALLPPVQFGLVGWLSGRVVFLNTNTQIWIGTQSGALTQDFPIFQQYFPQTTNARNSGATLFGLYSLNFHRDPIKLVDLFRCTITGGHCEQRFSTNLAEFSEDLWIYSPVEWDNDKPRWAHVGYSMKTTLRAEYNIWVWDSRSEQRHTGQTGRKTRVLGEGCEECK